jgi:hypothetical protein
MKELVLKGERVIIAWKFSRIKLVSGKSLSVRMLSLLGTMFYWMCVWSHREDEGDMIVLNMVCRW